MALLSSGRASGSTTTNEGLAFVSAARVKLEQNRPRIDDECITLSPGVAVQAADGNIGDNLDGGARSDFIRGESHD
jgi:hypothetical protein